LLAKFIDIGFKVTKYSKFLINGCLISPIFAATKVLWVE